MFTPSNLDETSPERRVRFDASIGLSPIAEEPPSESRASSLRKRFGALGMLGSN